MIVHDERSRHVVSDHRQAAAAIGHRLQQDILAMCQRLGGRRFRIDGLHSGAHADRLREAGHLEPHLHRGLRVRDDGDLAVRRAEPLSAHRNGIGTERGDELRLALRIGARGLRPGRSFPFDGNFGPFDSEVLRIPHDHAHRAEHLRVRGGREQQNR